MGLICANLFSLLYLALDAVSKLEEASEINTRKHDVIWTLGNAQTSLAFYTEDLEDAKPYFAKAMQWFQQALDEVRVCTLFFLITYVSWSSFLHGKLKFASFRILAISYT